MNPIANRPAAEAAFLPGIRQITDRAPARIVWAIPTAIMALITAALLWAILSEVDIIAPAQGTLLPAGRVKIIQPLESGVVKAIHVADGQKVAAGDLLIELDPTQVLADRDRLQNELASTRVTIARLDAALAGQDDFAPPPGIDPALAQTERSVLRADRARLAGEISALAKEKARLEISRESTLANIAKLDAVLPLIAERVSAREALVAKQFAARNDFLALKQELIETQADLAVLRTSLREAGAGIALAEERIEQARRDDRHKLLAERAEAERAAQALVEDLKKAEQRAQTFALRAPEDGVVQELAVHTVGGVAQGGQPLMKLVPQAAKLEVEAKIANRDIGFLGLGQPVKVKLEAFNFTKYGALDGVVSGISSDAVTDEQLGPVYIARIALDRQQMQIDGRPVDLTPGMAATVDIKTGSRRLIEYVLTPLQRYQDESLRER